MERFIGGVFIDKILRFAQDDNLKGVQYPLGAYLSQGGAEPRPCARTVSYTHLDVYKRQATDQF